MTFISYARNFEDVLLWRALGRVGTGFYIDVGVARHPDTDSATRAFYDRGWSGINVEASPEAAQRLRAARPRDVTVQASPGSAAETLAEPCRRHAPPEIHFLKVDAGGGEGDVLAGADFARFRPWIVLVAAAEDRPEWEPALLAAGYRFAWLDGLNRFYVAEEHALSLLPHFRLPPNARDDFLRAVDTEWACRVGATEMEAAVLRDRAERAEFRARVHEERAERALVRLGREAALTADAEARYAEAQRGLARLHREVAWRHEKLEHQDDLLQRVREFEREAEAARAWLRATHASTSWRLTAPLRRATALAGRLRGRAGEPAAALAAPQDDASARRPAEIQPTPVHARPASPIRTVHQFHAGSATGDAITNAMLLTRRLLRDMGYRSEIYVEHLDPALAGELRPLDELPRHADYVLLVRHSMGFDSLPRIVGLAAPKVLIYHNITPPEHLGHLPVLQSYARLGREQLPLLREQVVAALADSECNALELRALGFDPVQACPLLFDVAAMETSAGAAAREDCGPFTVLFVGRVLEAKGQADLIEAFARFRAEFAAPARLVLVGRHGGAEDRFHAALLAAVRRHRLDGDVVFTGAVSDAERDAWYGVADLYVSLSQHEGFGVPLVEAMARGVPVLAWPAGAVTETLGGGAELLEDMAPSVVAARMVALARDKVRREALGRRGRGAVGRFALGRHVPRLVEALVRAGAAPPPDPAARDALAAGMRFAIAGHVNGTYSLAAINRALALAIEAERPGRVRVLPVEGEPTEDLERVPAAERRAITALAARPAPGTGPEIVVSQHYPLYVPRPGRDLLLALFFWEESSVPADTVATLNAAFRGVLAPSRFVAKALVDSGVAVPVSVLGQAPPLEPFQALGEERRRRPRPPGPFTFLHVSSCFPRKGVDALLAAFARAFRRGDAVRLVIKGFPNPHNDVAEQIARRRAEDPDLPDIHLIDEDFSEAALLGLYREADAMVLPTRGEGYNLPAAEAMAAGLPLIVIGFGGHMDFLGPEEARLVEYDFAPSGSHVATAGSVWADPNVDDLALALRELVECPDAARERAARAETRIARETSRAALVSRLAGTALDLLLAPPPPLLRVAWVSTWDVPCGIAEYSRHLLASLPLDGIAELVVIADERSARPSKERPATPCARPVWRTGSRAYAPGIAAAIAAEDPGAVVVQHQPGLFPWRKLARLLCHRALAGRVTVVVLHNTRHLLETGEKERRATLRALAGASRVVVHTLADLNRLKSLGLVDNLALLPHGAPEPLPSRAQRALTPKGTGADAPLIGCYGFFLPNKGLPQLVEALALLRRRWPNARLRLVNARYDARESEGEIALCRAIVERSGMQGAVEFVTNFLQHEDSLALLAGCDVVALPYQSSKEAASGAVRIALAAGAPVAVTPLAVFDEAADAVAYLDGTDPEAIARGLDGLLSDRDRRASVAEAARRWLRERSWERTGQRLAGMLRGLVSAGAASPEHAQRPEWSGHAPGRAAAERRELRLQS